MRKLSLCMIVKNEEKTLARALENVTFADEIIIVDTGSSDNTKNIASKFTNKIFDFVWVGDFSKARNYSFDLASSEYLMWLDGDDIITKETADSILKWKEENGDIDVVMCPYVANFDENYKPIFEYLRERIVKNTKSLRWHDRVHEVIVPRGNIEKRYDIKIYHGSKERKQSDRNLNIYRSMISEGETFSPRAMFYYARELYFNNLFDEAIHEFSKFLSEGRGWKENNIEACQNMAKCYIQKKEYDNALTTLFGSFIYDEPRAEILYEIGNIYFKKEEYKRAIYWYKLALDSKLDIDSGAFVNKETCGLLPALQLCLCYDKLGDLIEAYHYHEVAKAFNPNDKAVIYNQEYFDKLIKKD